MVEQRGADQAFRVSANFHYLCSRASRNDFAIGAVVEQICNRLTSRDRHTLANTLVIRFLIFDSH